MLHGLVTRPGWEQVARAVFDAVIDRAPYEVLIDAISDRPENQLPEDALAGLGVLRELALERHQTLTSRRKKREPPSMTVIPIETSNERERNAALAFMPVSINLEIGRIGDDGCEVLVAGASDTGWSVWVDVDDAEWTWLVGRAFERGIRLEEWFETIP